MQGPLTNTDEWVDRLWSRPVASLLVWACRRTPVTPNQLTLVGAAHGIAAGVFLGLGWGGLSAAALAGFLAWDCADGGLARVRGGGSWLGRAVDGLGDYATGLAVHVGLVAWIAEIQGLERALWLGALSGVSLALCSMALDRYKRRYRGERDDLAEILRSRDHERGWRRWLLGRLVAYTERVNREAPIADLERYKVRAAPALRAWLGAGPSTHFGLLAVLAAFGEPVLYAWVALVPLNAVAVIAFALQRQAERAEAPTADAPARSG